MIKQLSLEAGEQTLYFQEGDSQYKINFHYLEETGLYYASVFVDDKFLVSNALRPFCNLLRLCSGGSLSWMTLYDTQIDKGGEKSLDYSDMKEALGDRYRLLYLYEAEEFETSLFEDMARHTEAYYGVLQ